MVNKNYKQKYQELKTKGIIDENDEVLIRGERVPFGYLNDECTDFNLPKGDAPYQSDEWMWNFVKRHGLHKTNGNNKNLIAIEMFKLADEGKYKKRNLIKVLRDKFPDVNSGVIHRLINKNLDLRRLEIDRTYKTKAYVIKGKYYIEE